MEEVKSVDFIRTIVANDIKNGKFGGKIVTRFPPEPNGYLHIGHAKAIYINFMIAIENGGITYLRFDDTNPEKETEEYIESIKEDVKWLGFDWGERLTYTSDYFDELYDFAIKLIKAGKAYVCNLNSEEIRKMRGTLTEPGKESPFRNRKVNENLELFQKMRLGEFEDGAAVLRAKIDMTSPNLNMRDPVMYRIKKMRHLRTKDKWCIYPSYDYSHPICDALEGITHSFCTLEFEDHRPLYDWFLNELSFTHHPQQIEFARLNLNYTVTSKRKLKELVDLSLVDGWDDPRMPTLVGLKRRGYSSESIRNFCKRIGVSKKETIIDMSILEECLREDLNEKAPRVMCVLRPLKLIIVNYPKNYEEELCAPVHPNNPDMGTRKFKFSNEIYIEEDDFMENPPNSYHRLGPAKEVRLRYGYVIKCIDYKKDSSGKIIEIYCTYDKNTLNVNPPDRKIKGIIHWVSKGSEVNVEVRLYDRLFSKPNPGEFDTDFKTHLNPNSLKILSNCKAEPYILEKEKRFQFERLGYFYKDSSLTSQNKLVFNRIATLKDSWAKIKNKIT